MGKKNWIEFDNHKKNSEETAKEDTFDKRSKINISKQKKGKKGKTITLIRGLGTEDEILLRELLKKIKVFCGTGGTLMIVISNYRVIWYQNQLSFFVKKDFIIYEARVKIGF